MTQTQTILFNTHYKAEIMEHNGRIPSHQLSYEPWKEINRIFCLISQIQHSPSSRCISSTTNLGSPLNITVDALVWCAVTSNKISPWSIPHQTAILTNQPVASCDWWCCDIKSIKQYSHLSGGAFQRKRNHLVRVSNAGYKSSIVYIRFMLLVIIVFILCNYRKWIWHT